MPRVHLARDVLQANLRVVSGHYIQTKYAHEEVGEECRVCDLVNVLVAVEGFIQDVDDVAPSQSDRIADAINGAALRGYRMAVEDFVRKLHKNPAVIGVYDTIIESLRK